MGNVASMMQFNEPLAQDQSGPACSPSLNDLLARLEDLSTEIRTFVKARASEPVTEGQLMREARQLYDLRRTVDIIFDHEGFSRSPAWDMMLDLFEAHAKKRSISVSSAGIGAACPGTTALRWIQVLEEMGLIVRQPDPLDKRRTIVSLTQDGLEKTTLALRARHQI